MDDILTNLTQIMTKPLSICSFNTSDNDSTHINDVYRNLCSITNSESPKNINYFVRFVCNATKVPTLEEMSKILCDSILATDLPRLETTASSATRSSDFLRVNETTCGLMPCANTSSTMIQGISMMTVLKNLQIFLYALIFLLAVIGNSLVIVTLARNVRMRTITNVFLLNLALSDLLLGVLCMPFTLVSL